MQEHSFHLLESLFQKYISSFEEISHRIEKSIIKTEYYTNYFYEIFPFYYQRLGFKKVEKLKILPIKSLIFMVLILMAILFLLKDLQV